MPKNDDIPAVSQPPPAPERLVSIEAQAEFDLFTGERQERLFLKLYVAARTSGLLAAISDRDWKTLCVLATYMDATGFCFPSQAELARAIGCSRQMVSERVNSLARFRFQDQPVLVIANEKHKVDGRFSHNGYRVLPLASLGIFDGAGTSGTTERRKQGPKSAVSRKPDTVSVSSDTGTVRLDTNKNQTVVNEISHSNIRKSDRSKDDFVDNSPSQWISDGEGRATARISAITHHGVEDLASIMARVAPQLNDVAPTKRPRGRPRKMPNVSPETYEAVVGVMQDYSRKLGDGEHLASNITQAVNLIAASGCDFNTFYMHVIDAYKVTSQRNGLENRSGYFFTVLRDSLLPSDTVGGHAR
jgi:hypothetical protein